MTIFIVEDRSYAAGTLTDGSDMLPSIAQWREQAFRFVSCPLFERHAGTIPAECTRRSQ
jgi:hypothetical protein